MATNRNDRTRLDPRERLITPNETKALHNLVDEFVKLVDDGSISLNYDDEDFIVLYNFFLHVEQALEVTDGLPVYYDRE